MPYTLKLKAGQHVFTDREKPVLDAEGKPTGRYERRTVVKDGILTSNKNLAATEPERYELVGGDAAVAAARIADLERQLATARAQHVTAQTATADDDDDTQPAPAPATTQTAWPAAAPLPTTQQPSKDLDAMTAQELRDYAEEYEIDLKGATRKDDMIRVIRAAGG